MFIFVRPVAESSAGVNRAMTGERPVLYVVARPEAAEAVATLFSKRGFVTETFSLADDVTDRLNELPAGTVAAAVVELSHGDGARAIAPLRYLAPRVALVGIADHDDDVVVMQ